MSPEEADRVFERFYRVDPSRSHDHGGSGLGLASASTIPNRAARGLITGRTGHLGVIVPDLLNPLFADICKGVQARARGLGHAVFVSDSERDEGLEEEAIRTMTPEVDGIVLCAPHLSSEELQCPCVMVGRGGGHGQADGDGHVHRPLRCAGELR